MYQDTVKKNPSGLYKILNYLNPVFQIVVEECLLTLLYSIVSVQWALRAFVYAQLS